jgi:hypothetical protein
MLADRQDDGSLYPDYDGFTIYNDGSNVTIALENHAERMANKQASCTPNPDNNDGTLIMTRLYYRFYRHSVAA